MLCGDECYAYALCGPGLRDCGSHECDTVFWPVHWYDSERDSGHAGEFQKGCDRSHIYYHFAAAGRKCDRAEDSWEINGAFSFLGRFFGYVFWEDMGDFWYAHRCAGVRGHLLYSGDHCQLPPVKTRPAEHYGGV